MLPYILLIVVGGFACVCCWNAGKELGFMQGEFAAERKQAEKEARHAAGK